MDGVLLPDTLSGAAIQQNSEGIINAIHILSIVIINPPVMSSRGRFLTLGAKLHESQSLLSRHVVILQVIICKMRETPISMEPGKVTLATSLYTIHLAGL